MEFIGTFFFILSIAMSFNPIAIASMLMAWVYIGAYVSGSHYNPLISLAMALRGRLAWDKLPWYCLAQIAGGCLAFFLAAHLHGHSIVPAPAENVTLLQAFIVEVLLSFVFAFIVLVVTTSEKYRGNHIFGFAIGFVVPALAGVGASISGGLFNPAIAIGASLHGLMAGLPIIWPHLLMYVGGALLGGALAAFAFHYFIAEKHEEIIIFNFIKR